MFVPQTFQQSCIAQGYICNHISAIQYTVRVIKKVTTNENRIPTAVNGLALAVNGYALTVNG